MFVRGERVLMDRDLADLYGVETKVLNQAVRRHSDRFPADFMFRLTAEEAENLRYQIGTSNSGAAAGPGHCGRRYLPDIEIMRP